MKKYQRLQVFPGDFDAVRAGNTEVVIRHDGGLLLARERTCPGALTFDPYFVMSPTRVEPRWFCDGCGSGWTDKRVKEIAAQDPGGTFWRQEVAGG